MNRTQPLKLDHQVVTDAAVADIKHCKLVVIDKLHTNRSSWIKEALNGRTTCLHGITQRLARHHTATCTASHSDLHGTTQRLARHHTATCTAPHSDLHGTTERCRVVVVL